MHVCERARMGWWMGGRVSVCIGSLRFVLLFCIPSLDYLCFYECKCVCVCVCACVCVRVHVCARASVSLFVVIAAPLTHFCHTMGRMTMKSTCSVLSHARPLAHALALNTHLMICTVCFACALRCAHFFVCSLAHSLAPKLMGKGFLSVN